MNKIPRTEWVALSDRVPDHDLICLVTDGREIAMAMSDRKFYRNEPHRVWWDACGCGGYDFEFNFEPTHWMPLSVQLP